MRSRTVVAPAMLALAVVLGGCGAAGTATEHTAAEQAVPPGMHRMPDGSLMSDAQMSGMSADGTGGMHPSAAASPSATAAMICSPETHDALRRAVGAATTPTSTARWADGIYTCTYHLAAGDLVVSVQDATDVAAGQRHFDALRSRMPGLHRITGLQALGLPGYADDAGMVLFLKDGKTLEVDATGLPASVGAYHRSPGDVAYGVAAAILACWSEH